MWHCVMCGISLDDAVKRLNDPLTMTPDQIIDGMDNEKDRIQQYISNRNGNRKKIKVTCGRVCGFNYASHVKTLDPISSYTNKIFDCPLCKHTSEGGRLLIISGKKKWICRKCHRKKITKDARQMWEEMHRDERNVYRNQWAKDNKGKIRRAKRRYRKRKGLKQYGIRKKNMWAYQYKSCIMCHSTRLKYRGRGYCRTCYYIAKRQKLF